MLSWIMYRTKRPCLFLSVLKHSGNACILYPVHLFVTSNALQKSSNYFVNRININLLIFVTGIKYFR